MLERSAIFRRAWQLRRWNAGDDRGFGFWLKLAWQEWKAGAASGWSFAPRVQDPVAAIEARLADLETTDRIGIAGILEMRRLRAEANALRRAGA